MRKSNAEEADEVLSQELVALGKATTPSPEGLLRMLENITSQKHVPSEIYSSKEGRVLTPSPFYFINTSMKILLGVFVLAAVFSGFSFLHFGKTPAPAAYQTQTAQTASQGTQATAVTPSGDVTADIAAAMNADFAADQSNASGDLSVANSAVSSQDDSVTSVSNSAYDSSF